jgi:glyoxylase-like metal-dependent hydrolase (beta-lactamase superfamily II)
MSLHEYYAVRELFPGVWGIGELGVNCYLVRGNERALLIDAGWGFGDLPELVASLAPLPLTVVNTHGHPDHTCGDFRFPEVFIIPADQTIFPVASPDARRMMLERVSARGPLPAGFDADAWTNAPAPNLQPLTPDAVFDLGGRTLRVIPTPGHTPGSCCLLDAGARLLFTGDTIVAGPILMFLQQSLPLRVYADSLQRLLSHNAEIDFLLPGHGEEPIPAARISELLQLATAILNGKITGEPQEHPLGSGLCARTDTCAICYKPENLE